MAVVAIAFAGAGVAAGGLDLPQRVVEVFRTGLCIVGGDVCRPVDAAAEGLSPCLTHERATGESLGVTIVALHIGHSGSWTVAERSDGSVLVTHVDDDVVGAEGGIGFSAPGVSVGATADADLSLAQGSAWELPSSAAAAELLAAVRRGDEPPVKPTWRFGDLGNELSGAVEAEIGNPLVAHRGANGHSGAFVVTALEASAGASAGVRVGRGQRTVYVHVHADASSPFFSLPGPSSTTSASPDGGNGGPLLIGITRDAHGLRELSLERAQPGARPGEVIDTVGRLDLRDPANRAAVAPLLANAVPFPPAALRALRAVIARTARVGTIERATYRVTSRSHDVSLALRLGAELGLDAGELDVERRLVAASAWTAGSQERKRLDCLPTEAA